MSVRFRKEQVLIIQAGLERPFAALAGNQAQPALVKPDQQEEMLLEIAAKRARMVRGQSQVFIHVKADHARPVDLTAGHKTGQELVLTGRGGEHEVGAPRGLLTVADGLTHRQCGRSSRPGAILVNLDLQRIDNELSDQPGIGTAHWPDPRVASFPNPNDPRLCGDRPRIDPPASYRNRGSVTTGIWHESRTVS